MSIRERVDALLARALHENTPPEEARTSAMIACRIIADHRLLDPQPEAKRSPWTKSEPPKASGWTRPPSNPPPSPKSEWKRFVSKFDGRCKLCGDWYFEGDVIAWKPKASVHWECFREYEPHP